MKKKKKKKNCRRRQKLSSTFTHWFSSLYIVVRLSDGADVLLSLRARSADEVWVVGVFCCCGGGGGK